MNLAPAAGGGGATMRRWVGLLLLASSLAVAAEEPNCDPEAGLTDAVCLDEAKAAREAESGCKYDGTQLEMNTCAVRDYKDSDAHLNETYRDVMAGLTPTNRPRLRQEQRAWLKKRDAECEREAKPSKGGSIWPLEFFGCMKAMTERRTTEVMMWRLRK